MDNVDQYIEKAKLAVCIEQNQGAREGFALNPDEVYIVWFCKTLGNWKALVSTDKFHGHYWEVTHNGAKNETYVDRYTKGNNIAISAENLVRTAIAPVGE